MAIQILVLTLPGTERLPSRYKAALPLRLAARPFLFLFLIAHAYSTFFSGTRLWYTPACLKVTAPLQPTTLSPQSNPSLSRQERHPTTTASLLKDIEWWDGTIRLSCCARQDKSS